MYAKIVDGRVTVYPYRLKMLRRDFPNISFPAEPRPEDLRRLGIVKVRSVEPPEPAAGQRVRGGRPEFRSDHWRQTWIIEAEEISAAASTIT